jgi:hypothetical protein
MFKNKSKGMFVFAIIQCSNMDQKNLFKQERTLDSKEIIYSIRIKENKIESSLFNELKNNIEIEMKNWSTKTKYRKRIKK